MVQFARWSYRGSAEELAGILRAYAAAGFSEIQVWLNPCTIAGIEAFAPVLELLNEDPAQPGPLTPL
jgi:sugar phosphate isomerase/epimerase